MEKIIDQLAEKYKIPKVAVKEALDSIFKYTKEMMAEEDLEGIMFTYFGKFVVKPGKKQWIMKYRHIKKRLDEIENEQGKTNPRGLGELDSTGVQSS